MADYRINMALWQVPTMVVNTHNDTEDNFQRTLTNTIANTPLPERVALLRKRVLKADAFFRTTPGPLNRRNVTVFAAPEYLFARSDSQHFITEDEKDQLVKSLRAISKEFPEVVLFPGTVAWTLRTHPGSKSTKEALKQRRQAEKQMQNEQVAIYSRREIKALRDAQAQEGDYFLARNTCYVMHKGKVVLEYHKRQSGGEVDRASDGANVHFFHGETDSVFAVRGLSFGLKICAEVSTPLSDLVDVQLVISASREAQPRDMQLKPGGYCGHADAMIKPSVTRYDQGRYVQVDASERRHGGGPITKNQAARRITHALSYKTNPQLLPDSQAFAEKITELRGRARYYRLDYDT